MRATAEATEQEQETAGPSIDLLPHQDAELAHLLDDSGTGYALTVIVGGRGSGKSETDYLQLFLRSERCVDQPFALFANTDAQLQTFIAIITEKLDAIGMRHVYETTAPKSWRKRWRREGIRVPPRRLRNLKMWIWEDGTHIFTGTLVNNSYTRIKSLDVQAALIEEGTEPGVTRNAITTILGAVRCGLGKSKNGTSECRRRRHLHEVVVKCNVPLLDPSNYIYSFVEEMEAKEEQRKHEGRPPFFRLIESGTTDNPHTGEDYVERLRAALDANTFEEQTSGKLRRNVAALSYHQFSDLNILGSLAYDPNRPLHIWFDFNATPATAGWGHDLRYDEVPEPELRSGHKYVGVIGELFSDNDPLLTDQVAEALLLDPKRDGVCVDCRHDMTEHIELNGFFCRTCAWSQPDDPARHCEGRTLEYSTKRKYIHAPDNWRGLMRHRSMIYVYGDVNDSAHTSSAVHGGSWQILRDAFASNLREGTYEFRVPKMNPRITLRVLAVNVGLQAKNGVRSVFVHPRCTAHIADFREVVPDPKTGEPKKVPKSPSQRRKDDYWKRTDISDAFGYFYAYRFPAIIPRAGAVPLAPADMLADGPYGGDEWPAP